MVAYIPAPEPQVLLPPLLACLPAGFASPRPPPALLPLLSPVLRQRVQLLSSVSASPTDSWIRLLCWNAGRGEQIERIVGEASFEPHPVSGEIEIPDDTRTRYKRIDTETLRACFPLPDYNLAVTYVWCPGDQEGGGPGWRVAEVLPLDTYEDEAHTWLPSIGEADELRQEIMLHEALQDAEDEAKRLGAHRELQQADDSNEEDDNDYWAQYDDNLGSTPARRDSPQVNTRRTLEQPPEASDTSYYSRYNEVQPALDNDDPSVDRNDIGDSSLSGDAVTNMLRQHIGSVAQRSGSPAQHDLDNSLIGLNHPRPESASSRGSDAILKLERTAETQSISERGVREHIASQIRSLHQLARCTGIPEDEFVDLVRKELEELEFAESDQ